MDESLHMLLMEAIHLSTMLPNHSIISRLSQQLQQESGPDPRSGTGEANTWWLLESCHHDKDLQHFLLLIMVRLPQILQSLGTGIWDHIMKISNHVSMTRIYSIFCYQ